MDKTICFVVGLPGSGKSKYLEQLHKSGIVTINDPADFEQDVMPSLTGEEQIIAVADYSLCFSANREKMVIAIRKAAPEVVFRWIYFENNPIQCISNLRAAGRAGGKGGENLVWQTARGYSIPGNIEARPVMILDKGADREYPSYTPAVSALTAYKLVRVFDDLVLFSSNDWESFRATAWYILQKFPAHHYIVVEEVITRDVKEIVFDRLIG